MTWRVRWSWPVSLERGDFTLLLGISVWRRARGSWTIDIPLLVGWLTIATGYFPNLDRTG